MPDSAPASTPQSLAGPRCVALALVLAALSTGPPATLAQSSSRADGESDRRARQALSVQLGGQGGTYSVHYSRRLYDRWSWRAGLGVRAIIRPAVVRDDPLPSRFRGAPVGLQFWPGTGDWRLELGLTVAPAVAEGETTRPAVWGLPAGRWAVFSGHGDGYRHGDARRRGRWPWIRAGSRDRFLDRCQGGAASTEATTGATTSSAK